MWLLIALLQYTIHLSYRPTSLMFSLNTYSSRFLEQLNKHYFSTSLLQARLPDLRYLNWRPSTNLQTLIRFFLRTKSGVI